MKTYRLFVLVFGILMLLPVAASLLLGDEAAPWIMVFEYALVPLAFFLVVFFLVKLFRSGMSVAKRDKSSPKHPVI